MFRGLYTALITPFKKQEVDIKSFKKLVDWQVNSGVNGLVVLGSTGEGSILSDEEREELIKTCLDVVKASKRKVPVIVGTGSNSTMITLKYTQHAKQLGANGALIVCPYYNKPPQEGIYQHYKYINDNINFPILVYNVPGRTIVNISDQVIARLAKLKNIVGVKDATGDLSRPISLAKLINNQSKFIQISGEDATAVNFNLSGGVGCISISGNILPTQLTKVQELTLMERFKEALEEYKRYEEIISYNYCETNPIPIKYMVYRMGLIASPEMRLPLIRLSEANRAKVDIALKSVGLIK
jgi:4-hydroxy-tetrahydrodipicolinate synthase